MKDDDVVQAVEKLGFELAFQRLLDALFHAVVGALLARLREPEGRSLPDLVRADVAGQNDDGVLEGHHPAAAVRQPAVVEDLQQQIEYVRMRLFDLVEQHDRIGLAADALGELSASLVKADVPGGRADEFGDGALLHVLGHIQPHEHLLVAEHTLGKRLGKVCFSNARRADEDEGADGLARVLEPRARTADRLGNGGDCLLLPHDAAVQLLLEVHEPLALRLGELVDGYARPTAHNGGDFLRPDGKMRGIALRLPRFASDGDGLRERFDLPIQLRAPRRIVPLCRLLAVGPEPRELLFGGTELLRPRVRIQPRLARRLIDEVDRLVGQVAVGDITVGKAHRRLDRGVRNDDVVMRLVLILDAAQNGDRVLDARLGDNDGRKTAFERRVLFDVLAVLLQGRRADRLQFPAREHGF